MGDMMPRLFIFGDSTAAAKEDKARPETGWGECFSRYLSPSWILDNRAVNGRSTRLVLSNGDFFRALSDSAEGDAALIQYGHNESKMDEERHTDPWTSFKDNLTYMAASLGKRGVSVYFLTPIARRCFKDGILVDTHGDYPDAMKETAKELSIPLIDMTKATMDMIRETGEEESREYFMNFAPAIYENYPEGDEDNTHLRPKGAEAVASLVYSLLRQYEPPFLIKA